LSLRLKSLAYTRRGQDGWSSGPFPFSDGLTVLEGPNGAGKTPMLKGIAYCLGHPLQLPPDIIIRCETIVLEIYHEGGVVTIERMIQLNFRAVITLESDREEFDNIKDFSTRICGLFDIQERTLATRGAGVAPLYMAFFIPMFWIDQDIGWKDLYSPLQTNNFVKDQFEEIVRVLLGLPGRNRATDKNEYEAAVVRAEAAKQRAEIKHEVLQSLEKSLLEFGPRTTLEQLSERKSALALELRDKSSAIEVIAKQSSTFDETITTRRSHRDAALFTYQAAIRRLEELRSYGTTLEAQVSIVETNEVAADAFRSLCGNNACEFFRQPEESYGRRVLYIKDQIKDFDTSMLLLHQESERLHARVTETEQLLARAIQERTVQLQAASGDQIVEEVDRITREFANVSAQSLQTERYEAERLEFKKLIDLSINAEDAAKNLRPIRGVNRDESAAWDAANELGQLFNSWLITLSTPNPPKQIWFDEHFSLMLGGSRFTEDAPFGGSTRTRIVLAFHASLVELSLKMGGTHPQILVLDTPKQHELHSKDLKAFVNRFLQLRTTYSTELQLVVAATELEFLDESLGATIWHPFFSVGAEPRFFGRYLPSFAVAYE
jgi:AAA domain